MSIANAASQPAATAELHIMSQPAYREINGQSLANTTICDGWNSETASEVYLSELEHLVPGGAERNLLITCYGAAHCKAHGDCLTVGVADEYLFSPDVEADALAFYYSITSVPAPEITPQGEWV